MAEAIIYCDRCGRIILPSELASGEALVSSSFAVCRSCTKTLSPEERKALVSALAPTAALAPPAEKTPLPGPRAAGLRPEAAMRRPKGPGLPMALLFGVGLGAGALAAVAAVMLARSGTKPTRTGLPPPPASIMAVTPRETPPIASDSLPPPAPAPGRAVVERASLSPVQARLAALRDLADPGLSRYEELRAEGAKFLAEFEKSPEAEEARAILRDAEARYIEQADDALKAALGAAETFLAQGRFDEALKAFGYVRMRFGSSDWFREKAEPAIAAVETRIKEASARLATQGASVSEDFSRYAEGRFADPAWTLKGSWTIASGALVGEGEGQAMAVMGVPESGALVFEATARPRARMGAGWASTGLVLYRDDANLWALSLVEAEDGTRYLELHELLDGKWMAQLGESKLTLVESRSTGLTYDHRYRLRLELTPDSIVGSARDLDGQDQGRIAYKFDNKAVTSGRPALRVAACRAEFDDISVTIGRPAAAAPTIEPGGSNGLLGEYFEGTDLEPGRLRLRRVDPRVDFNWGRGPPAEGLPTDDFSIRWTGEVFLSSPGSWTFHLSHDDGVRLWVGDKLVIDDWREAVAESSGRAEGLAAGWVPIRLEYFERGREAIVRLSWAGPGGAMSVIPQTHLRTPGADRVATPRAPEIPPGLPPGARESGGRWYAYFPEPGSWHSARRRCEEMGGHLVTIASQEENAFVKSLLGSNAWIGLTDEGHEGRWEWVTGETVAFTAWSRGEPSGGEENYLEMRASDPPSANWNDLKGDSNVPGFVCEWEPEVLRLASPADACARPERDGYWLDPGLLVKLSRRFDPARATAKKLAAVGGGLAALAAFDQALKKELPPKDGYAFASKAGLSSAGMTLAAARKAAEKALGRERPELVMIGFDAGVLREGRPPQAYRTDLAELVAEVQELGAVPVLFTLGMPRPQDTRALELVERFNKLVREVASESGVPWLDAWGLLNADPAASFGAGGALKAAAVEALAKRFARLYRVLERSVMGRQVEVPLNKYAASGRVTDGLVALWLFDELPGAAVRDRSGAGVAPDLRPKDPTKLRSLGGRGGLELAGPTALASETSAGRLVERLKAAGRLSVEAWFEPANLSQSGPARIVSLSQDTLARDFTLGQAGLELVFRLRTSKTNPNGEPALQTKGLAFGPGPVHAVAAFDGTTARLYVNGREREERHEPGGDLSTWQAFPLVVGNEFTGDRPWLGKLYLVAIYDRALSAEEVLRNYAAKVEPLARP